MQRPYNRITYVYTYIEWEILKAIISQLFPFISIVDRKRILNVPRQTNPPSSFL